MTSICFANPPGADFPWDPTHPDYWSRNNGGGGSGSRAPFYVEDLSVGGEYNESVWMLFGFEGTGKKKVGKEGAGDDEVQKTSAFWLRIDLGFDPDKDEAEEIVPYVHFEFLLYEAGSEKELQKWGFRWVHAEIDRNIALGEHFDVVIRPLGYYVAGETEKDHIDEAFRAFGKIILDGPGFNYSFTTVDDYFMGVEIARLHGLVGGDWELRPDLRLKWTTVELDVGVGFGRTFNQKPFLYDQWGEKVTGQISSKAELIFETDVVDVMAFAELGMRFYHFIGLQESVKYDETQFQAHQFYGQLGLAIREHQERPQPKQSELELEDE